MNETEVSDERLSLPSASSMDRIMACPGSFNLQKQFPRCDTPSGKRGTKIHAALEGKIPVESLSKSDKISYERHAYNEGVLVEKHGMEGAALYKEERFWVTDEKLDPLYSAKPDRVYILNEKALVINYKNGFTPQKPINQSWQIITEIAAVTMNFSKVNWFVGAFTHPNSPHEGKEQQDVIITKPCVLIYADEIAEKTKEALKADAPRIAGHEQCEWCNGKLSGVCKEWKAWKSKK